MASLTKARLLRDKTPSTPQAAARGGAVRLGLVALAAAAAAALALPAATFTASAVVGVEGGPASLRPALIQGAADAARSRQVAARAAASLAAKAAMRPEALAAAIHLDAGRIPGTLVLRADDADAERAATMANALAAALTAELEDRTQATRRDGDSADALRLSRLQDIAADAHRKLTALGGDVADPAASRATAAARAETLRTRLDAIRSILAAGNPPLGAGRDVPPNIDALQTGYLDLTRQLAKARETLGERHTTVVGLQEAIRRSAAELTAGWTRLAKATEQELADAKARAAAAAKGGFDLSRAAALDAARAAVRVADDAVTRAAAPADGDDQPRWHLVARASAPAIADGLGLPIRLAIAGAVGLLVLLLGPKLFSRRNRERDDAIAVAPVFTAAPAPAIEPTFFDDAAMSTMPDEALSDMEPEAEPQMAQPRAEPALASPRPMRAPVAPRENIDLDELLREVGDAPSTRAGSDLVPAIARVLPAIDALVPRAGIPVVLVASDEAGVDTTETVLALGAAAAAEGRRVLVVEGARAHPSLAAAAGPDAVPALVDVFGQTRVVLRAEAAHIYLAPAFRARLAADLARAGTAVVADDIADEFDLVVIDGDRAVDAVALADEADAVLRVGRFASPRDAAQFLAALGAPDASFLGTVATAISVFVPQVTPRPAVATPRPAAMRTNFGVHPLRRSAPAEARRRVGQR